MTEAVLTVGTDRRVRHRRELAVTLALAILAVALALVFVSIGDYPLSLDAVITSLLSPVTGAAEWPERADRRASHARRLPRLAGRAAGGAP